MLPAHQRFHTHDAARVGADLRLVVQHQLVAFHGQVQAAFDGAGLFHLGLQAGREESNGVAPLAFGLVDSGFGGLGQQRQGAAVVGEFGHAHAGGDAQHLLTHGHGRFQGVHQAVGHVAGVARAGVGQQHDEVVAAQAGHGVIGLEVADQALRHGHQHLVAHLVAKRLVDVFEVVHVQVHHRGVVVVALGRRQGHFGAVKQQGAVGQVGERVVVHQPLDAGLGVFAAGRFGEQAQVLLGLALRPGDGADGEPLGVQLAVFAAVPDFTFPAAVLGHGLPHGPVKAWVVHTRTQNGRCFAGQFVQRVPGDLGERLVD